MSKRILVALVDDGDEIVEPDFLLPVSTPSEDLEECIRDLVTRFKVNMEGWGNDSDELIDA